MNMDYIITAAITPEIRVADVGFNKDQIISLMKKAYDAGAGVMVFPELCITGYTCGDLFLQNALLDKASEALMEIVEASENIKAISFIGFPLRIMGKLYNTAAVISSGKLLAFIPKRHIPQYGEFYELRHFTPAPSKTYVIKFANTECYFGTDVIFMPEGGSSKAAIACEICEDLWAPEPPSGSHALAGANIIVNLSASNAIVGKEGYRELLLKSTSARYLCAYVYANAGEGESTQDMVFSGERLIAENGNIIEESPSFTTGITIASIDTQLLMHERMRMNTWPCEEEAKSGDKEYIYCSFPMEPVNGIPQTRAFMRYPFVPQDERERKSRCEEILSIQSMGLKKRLSHINAGGAVVGISGGLDSTLALIITVRAFDSLGLPRNKITAVTMPGFGTTDRTYDNACGLAKAFGLNLREISIADSVRSHFKDIGQDESVHDVTYENSQARERTQILMDIANMTGGLVVGTGDMSELALGWATYNGDHMSMYGVNGGVPKTLIRHLVDYYADICKEAGDPDNAELCRILKDILDTPVSPELLPPDKGEISQKTEDLVGPYELHDFFLYYMLRYGFSPSKIYLAACKTFKGIFEDEIIKKWLQIFVRRFFSQHYKRSCLPDGPKVGSVGLSPRGDLRMPSDGVCALWIEELAALK